MALPPFLLASKTIPGKLDVASTDRQWLALSWICTTSSIGIITSFGVVCYFLWLTYFLSPQIALLTTFVFAFGSMVLPYSTMLMSHGVVAGLLAIALWALRTPQTDAQLVHRDFIGGGACGLAIACEYDSSLVAGAILLLAFRVDFYKGIRVIFGAIPPLSLIPLYNWICTGTCFSLPYHHEVSFTEMSTGFVGIHYPDAYKALELLISPERGLFFWTPFLLLALISCADWPRKHRFLCLVCCLVSLLQVVVISGYFFVSGGLACGPRFLAPVLPLLMLPAGFGASRMPRMAIVLAATSVLFMTAATVADVKLATDMGNPEFDSYLPAMFQGRISFCVGQFLGLSRGFAMVPLLAVWFGGFVYLMRTLKPTNSL